MIKIYRLSRFVNTERVPRSYGLGWGDGGYANYIRGTITLGRCSFYKTAFKIMTTVRRGKWALKVPPFEAGPSYMESSANVPTRPQTVYSI